MKTQRFECEDGYEAEKLASLLSIQKDGTVWLAGIATVVGNEVVIQLKDKSSHAILLKGKPDAENLRKFLSDVVEGKVTIHSSRSSGGAVEIELD
jgi:hypothetical protein